MWMDWMLKSNWKWEKQPASGAGPGSLSAGGNVSHVLYSLVLSCFSYIFYIYQQNYWAIVLGKECCRDCKFCSRPKYMYICFRMASLPTTEHTFRPYLQVLGLFAALRVKVRKSNACILASEAWSDIRGSHWRDRIASFRSFLQVKQWSIYSRIRILSPMDGTRNCVCCDGSTVTYITSVFLELERSCDYSECGRLWEYIEWSTSCFISALAIYILTYQYLNFIHFLTECYLRN